MATIDEFKKLDIRIAEIKSVEDHPNADRLYVLTVNEGQSDRTIVAGIKQFYTKEELVGKKIPVIVNLDPATIRGVTSRGMLLAVRDGESLSLIIPEKSVAAGSCIS